MGWRPQPRFDPSRNRWYVNLRGRRYILGKAYPGAVRRFAELLAELGMDGAKAPARVPVTVAELIEEWTRWHPGEWQRWMIRPFFDFAGYARLHDVKPDILDGYLRTLIRAKYAPQTIRHMLTRAAGVLRIGAENGWIKATSKLPKMPAITKDPKDVDAPVLESIGAAFEHPQRHRVARIARFILATGCRPGEARNLTWRQVRYDRGICTIRDHKTAHRGKTRTIYLTTDALAALKSASAADGIELDAPVFRSRRGGAYSASGLRRILTRLGVRPHQLRHTFAQNALATLPIEDVSKLLGHAQLRTTQIYAHIQNDRALAAAKTLVSPLRHRPGAGPRGRPRTSPSAPRKTPKKNERRSGKTRPRQAAKLVTARRGSGRGRTAASA